MAKQINPYAGTPEGATWDQYEKRKAIRSALLKDIMSDNKTQTFGKYGIAAQDPYSGIGKIFQGLLAGKMMRDEEKGKKELEKTFGDSRKTANDAVVGALLGDPGKAHDVDYFDENEPRIPGMWDETPTAPDSRKAITEALASKYTSPEILNLAGTMYAQDMKHKGAMELQELKNKGGSTSKSWSSVHDVTLKDESGNPITVKIPWDNNNKVWLYDQIPGLTGMKVTIPGQPNESRPNEKFSGTIQKSATETPVLSGIGTSPKYDADVQSNIAGGKEKAKQDVLLETEPEKQNKIMIEKNEATKQINKPKVVSYIRSLREKHKQVNKKIDEAFKNTNWFTAGPSGLLDFIPGSPPKGLKTTLETIRANLGFDELKEMREHSPTGGALGQVSELENKLLQAVQGSLDNLNKPSALRQNLMDIKAIRDKLDLILLEKYKMDYGEDFDMSYEDKLNADKVPVTVKFDDEEEAAYQKWKAQQQGQ